MKKTSTSAAVRNGSLMVKNDGHIGLGAAGYGCIALA